MFSRSTSSLIRDLDEVEAVASLYGSYLADMWRGMDTRGLDRHALIQDLWLWLLDW